MREVLVYTNLGVVGSTACIGTAGVIAAGRRSAPGMVIAAGLWNMGPPIVSF